MTQIIHIEMLMYSLNKHPNLMTKIIHIWMLMYALNKHPKFDDYYRCVQTLVPDVVAPETHQNSLRELKLWTFESLRKIF